MYFFKKKCKKSALCSALVLLWELEKRDLELTLTIRKGQSCCGSPVEFSPLVLRSHA